MKLLHTADWHLGARLQGRTRLPEQTDLLREICEIADKEDVDLVIIAGDVFDTYSPPIEAERLYYETTARLADGGRRAIVVIAGNHDSPDRLVASKALSQAHGVITLGYPKDDPGTFDLGPDRIACVESAPAFARLRVATGQNISLIVLPYPSESRLSELLSSAIEDEVEAHRGYNERLAEIMGTLAERFVADEPAVVVSHLFVSGGAETGYERPIQVGGAYAVHPSTFPPSASYVALGHLHAPQEFNRRKGQTIRYSGSILQNGFGEEGQTKSVTIVEFTRGRANCREVPLACGRPLVRIAASRLDELTSSIASLDGEPWIGIDYTLLEGSAPEDLDDLRRRTPSIVDVAFHHEGESEESADSGTSVLRLSIDEQFRRYVASAFNESCDEEILKLFMALVESSRFTPDS